MTGTATVPGVGRAALAARVLGSGVLWGAACGPVFLVTLTLVLGGDDGRGVEGALAVAPPGLLYGALGGAVMGLVAGLVVATFAGRVPAPIVGAAAAVLAPAAGSALVLVAVGGDLRALVGLVPMTAIALGPVWWVARSAARSVEARPARTRVEA